MAKKVKDNYIVPYQSAEVNDWMIDWLNKRSHILYNNKIEYEGNTTPIKMSEYRKLKKLPWEENLGIEVANEQLQNMLNTKEYRFDYGKPTKIHFGEFNVDDYSSPWYFNYPYPKDINKLRENALLINEGAITFQKKYGSDSNRIIYNNMAFPYDLQGGPDTPYYPKGVITHEKAHTLVNYDGKVNKPQEGAIKNRNPEGNLLEGIEKNKYLESPSEIYSRLMDFRFRNKLDPQKRYTIEDVRKFRKDAYDTELLERYSDEFILQLLNEVADTRTNSNNINKPLLKANYFEDGGKVTLEGVAGATGTLGNLVTNAINQAKITDPSSLKKSMIASGTTPIGANDYNALSSMWIGNNEWRDYNYRDFRDKSIGEDIWNGVSAGIQGSSAGLSAGGPIGAIIGGVVGTGSSIIGSAIGRHKARKTAREVNALGDQMNASRLNNFITNAENIAYSNTSNVLRNSFKEGGFLNMKNKNIYKTGGPLESPNGFTDINAGGTHEQNPRGGVPVGYGDNGLMNLLEEGEVIAKEPSYRESRAPEYVFNNNNYIDSTTKKKLGIKRIKNLTYAEALKEIRREADERPNDPISRDTLNKKMEYLKKTQERDNAMRAMQQQQAQGVNKYELGDEFYRLSSYKNPQLEIPKVSYSSNIPNVWNRASLDAPPIEPPRYYLTDRVRGVDLPPINEGLNLSYMGPDKITVGGGKVKKFMPDDDNGSALAYLQHAPLLGGAISLASALRKPDYKYANQLLDAAKDSLHNVDSMRPLLYADYMQMRPTDRNYYSNKLAAQAGATRRSILNSMNANPYASGMHLLAADNNILSQQGDLLFKGDKENWERYKDVSSYRQDTNKVRSSLMADYDKMNLAAKTQNNASYLNAIAQGLAMKSAIDANRVNAINSGATTLLTDLGELGRQMADRNSINSLNSLYYYIDNRKNIRYKKAFYDLTPSEQLQIKKEAMDNIKLYNGIKEDSKENG